MKLAFVVKTLDSRGGGAERVLTQVTSHLAGRGHDVQLLLFGRADEQDFYSVDPAVQRAALATGNTQSRSGVRDVVARAKALRRAIKKSNPDVAVGFMHSAYVPLALGLCGSRIPVVASEHIVYGHYRNFPHEALILQATAPLYIRITAISETMRRSFPPSLAKKMTVIPNPITPVVGRADPVGTGEKLILNVGRLTRQKDQRTLIQAFAQMAPVFPDWRLRIVGEGPLHEELEALAAKAGCKDRVEISGATRDIAGEYRGAQLFAMSSSYESFGLATAEALSAGLPAIGFADCAGTNELIQHEVNGLLVGGADRTTAFAHGLKLLMESPDLRRRLGAAGPSSVQRFTIDEIGAQWEAMLLDVARQSCVP